ncbi:TetR/AcrR family transcriptional regulator [Peribacillus sp. NPDC097675]|uniref:TetR/AcrR family transcriptional regulator n=1 Tax=Peribacillus sp. NPDC097675 TaxID=3390618 RepID=UPI003D08B121
MKKVDRRIRRTRQSLKDALISLIEEKELSAISITDIVNRSDVNRSTFYAHFRDKEELLTCLINELLDGMIHCMRESSLQNHTKTNPVCGTSIEILQLFIYIEKHSAYFKTLMNHERVPQFMIHISQTMYNFYFKEIKTLECEERLNQGFLATYLSSVLAGFIYHWLVQTDMKYTSTYIAQEYTKILTMKLLPPQFTHIE